MSDEAKVDPSCQVCGRRLLPGERATLYVTRDGTEASVCELCRPRAEAAGWLLPHEAEARGGVGRERRRPRGQMLGGLLSRLPAATNGEPRDAGDEPPHSAETAGGARRPDRSERAAEARGAPGLIPAGGEGVGTTVPGALLAFNASDHRRTVAGLSRTLGPPRATALAVRAGDGSPGARLTVAWELTWYQWEVAPGPQGPEVRESGKGETIGQLRTADRSWNLLVGSDGTLEQRASAAEESGGGES